jgi:hypothetical protein
MSKQQTRHTEAFRRETVNLLESSGKSVAGLDPFWWRVLSEKSHCECAASKAAGLV